MFAASPLARCAAKSNDWPPLSRAADAQDYDMVLWALHAGAVPGGFGEVAYDRALHLEQLVPSGAGMGVVVGVARFRAPPPRVRLRWDGTYQ